MNRIDIIEIVFTILFVIWFIHFNNKAIVTTEYKLNLLNVEAEILRIVQVSDLQSRSFGKGQRNLLNKVAKAKPDIIVITGDLIDRNFTDYEKAMDAVKGLASIAKVFYVQGNHEESLQVEAYRDFLMKSEKYMEILLDRRYEFTKSGRVFCIGGLSEKTVDKSRGNDRNNRNHDEKLIIDAAEEIFTDAEGDVKILLSHEPQLIDIYAKTSCDLVMSGHAHGGQFRIPFVNIGLYSPEQGLFPKYYQGVHQCQGKDGHRMNMVISRGLGNSKFPVRLFNRPEIVLLKIK